jgi:hypothetical protein
MAKVFRHDEHIPSYNLMLAQVEGIDPDAAWYLEECAKRGLARRTGILTNCFTFADTPQGRDFWADLCNKILRGWDNNNIGFEYDEE